MVLTGCWSLLLVVAREIQGVGSSFQSVLENQVVVASFVLVHINIECILFIDNIKEAFSGFPHLGFPCKNIVSCAYM